MPMRSNHAPGIAALLVLAAPALADDGPSVVPATRSELKAFLED